MKAGQRERQLPLPLAKPGTISPQAMPGQSLVNNPEELVCTQRVNALLAQITDLQIESCVSEQLVEADSKLKTVIPEAVDAINELAFAFSQQNLSPEQADTRQRLLNTKGLLSESFALLEVLLK